MFATTQNQLASSTPSKVPPGALTSINIKHGLLYGSLSLLNLSEFKIMCFSAHIIATAQRRKAES